MNSSALIAAALLGAACSLSVAAQEPAAPAVETVPWEQWQAGNEVANVASLQRGFRNFMNYCVGCHSMKYVRYSRVATDLKIPTGMLRADLLPDGAAPADYIHASLQAQDGVAWFGKEPPDLSLIARSLGVDKSYRFLKTFYLDPSRPTRTNNLVLDAAAMPAVLSDLEGVKAAVFRDIKVTVEGRSITEKKFDHFVTVATGRMSGPEFDAFLRDTVNFLDYAGEPAQVDRRSIGVWVVLFLLVFTWLAWLLKKEYWKDVH